MTVPPTITHINPHLVGEFAKAPYRPGMHVMQTPRLAYGVTEDGRLLWIGRHHRDMQADFRGKVKHWGFLMKEDFGIRHAPFSTSIPSEPVPENFMDAVEAEVLKHEQVQILRQKPA